MKTIEEITKEEFKTICKNKKKKLYKEILELKTKLKLYNYYADIECKIPYYEKRYKIKYFINTKTKEIYYDVIIKGDLK